KKLNQTALDAALAAGALHDARIDGLEIAAARGLAATNAVFDATQLRQCDLAAARFCDCVFLGCSFRSADLTECRFEGCKFYDADSERTCDFSYADLRRSQFERCDLTTAKLVHVRAFGIELKACQCSGAELADADFALGTGNFCSATFDGCNLAYADFSRTHLTECTLVGGLLRADPPGVRARGRSAQSRDLQRREPRTRRPLRRGAREHRRTRARAHRRRPTRRDVQQSESTRDGP